MVRNHYDYLVGHSISIFILFLTQITTKVILKEITVTFMRKTETLIKILKFTIQTKVTASTESVEQISEKLI